MAYSEPNACQLNCAHDELTSSGYESELFMYPNKTFDFLCVICQLVAKRPKTHSSLPNSRNCCKVIFCYDCLKNYLRHHKNSLSTSDNDQQQGASCPFRCGSSLICRGIDKNIINIPKKTFYKLCSMQMLCPNGRGIIRYKDYEEHASSRSCDCIGFTENQRRVMEKRIDSMLNLVCDGGIGKDEMQLVRGIARLYLNSLYPE